MKRWNLFLPDSLLEKLKARAAREGVSAAELVRKVLEMTLR
jgi:plasmid stability protein